MLSTQMVKSQESRGADRARRRDETRRDEVRSVVWMDTEKGQSPQGNIPEEKKKHK